MHPTPRLSLVVPVWNPGDALPGTLEAVADFLDRKAGKAEVVFVDDASTDAHTRRLLAEFAATVPSATVLHNGRNQGKGFAVSRGIQASRGEFRVFTDVDLAYPLTEVDKIVETLERGADVAIACRVLPDSRYVMSPSFFHYLYTRHLMSRAYNIMVRALLLPGVLDTQAGLKGFTASAARQIFPRLTRTGFGFDMEALYIAKVRGLTVHPVPVAFRYDHESTTVRFLRDGLAMARDLARVRVNGWLGRYALGPEAPEQTSDAVPEMTLGITA